MKELLAIWKQGIAKNVFQICNGGVCRRKLPPRIIFNNFNTNLAKYRVGKQYIIVIMSLLFAHVD